MPLTVELLCTFFGWCFVINSVILGASTLVLIVGLNWIPRLHAKVLDLPEVSVRSEYFSFLAKYKLMILVFNLAPYVALKIML